ncbi:MAG: TatD family hydrolase [Candidatus Pacebacteria bacterium]|jgi:TatD DNase family protein|nr:TatD family hydrolase [Candidatus Paceibacterota bacterium]
MKWIDTHAHLNLSAFHDDVEAVAARCIAEEVSVINIGTKLSTSMRAVELALRHEYMYAIVGLHPIQTVPGTHDEDEIGEGGQPFVSRGEVFDIASFRTLAQSPKVVGIGECGFDYWHCPKETYEIQETAFLEQIKLANELGLPLMIHTRGPKPGEASPTGRSVYEDVYELLKTHAKVPFNVHFYAGTLEEAKRFFEIGGTISFTGVVTFAKAYEGIIKAVPLDKIHAETDCPYVAPVPYRGGRCEPWMVKEVYKKIAAIREEDEELVREALLQNARKMYRL